MNQLQATAGIRPNTLSQNLLDRIDVLGNQVQEIENGLRRNADRLMGTEPPTGVTGKTGPAAVPNGTLAELDASVDALGARLTALSVQADRFDNA